MSLKRTRLGFERLETRCLLSVTAAANVYVHIPDNLTGLPGAQVTVPVQVDNAAGIRGAEITINYDNTVLHTTDAGVQVGSVWPAGDATLVVANVNDAAGTIVAFVSTAQALPAGSGSLLQAQFTIANGAAVGSTTAIDLAKVRLNEGAIVPNPQPQPGPDSTDGRITVISGSTGIIAGTVYADTNSNNRPDQFEGIPGVQIILVRADNGQRTVATTDDAGYYEFAGLAAGTYQVVEQQPAAYLDGGTNGITATLTDGQSFTADFRELGLRPQYVFNRLFTTTALPVGSANWVNAIRGIVTSAQTNAAGSLTASARVPQQAAKTVSHVTSATTTSTVVASRNVVTPHAGLLTASQIQRRRAVDLLLASQNR